MEATYMFVSILFTPTYPFKATIELLCPSVAIPLVK